jgi:hypothetical protein
VRGGRIFVTLLVALPACNRCSGSTVGPPNATTDAATEAKVVQVDVLPPPAGWKFEPVRLGPSFPGTALPPGCSTREPLVHAKVRSSSRFVAAPSALGTLVIADADVTETPPRLVGVAAFDLDPGGTSTKPEAIPWVEAGAMPRLARTSNGAWLAAYAEPAAGKYSEVFVFQNGSATSVGEGDQFEPIDLSCDGAICLLLTTRLGNVAASGGDIWLGKPSEPVTSWQRQEIVPRAGDSDARPSGIARMDTSWTDPHGNTVRGAVVGLFEGSELVFWGINSTDKPHEIGKISAPHGIVDATVLGRPVAFVYGAPVDDEGCAQQGGIMCVFPGWERLRLNCGRQLPRQAAHSVPSDVEALQHTSLRSGAARLARSSMGSSLPMTAPRHPRPCQSATRRVLPSRPKATKWTCGFSATMKSCGFEQPARPLRSVRKFQKCPAEFSERCHRG